MDRITEIKKSLNTVNIFNDEHLNAFITKLKPKKIARKEYLLQPLNKCDFIAYINKGSFRFYSLTDTEEPTLHFFTENNWVADYESLISQQATENYIQAIEDTEVQVISLENIHLLMEQYPVFRNLLSLMNNWVIPSSHHISVIKSTPDDRYKKLLIEHPDWLNRFPQMYIASYLGMTKETFSRVKARVK